MREISIYFAKQMKRVRRLKSFKKVLDFWAGLVYNIMCICNECFRLWAQAPTALRREPCQAGNRAALSGKLCVYGKFALITENTSDCR